MATSIATTSHVVKNLLIKDAQGNTQVIEVVQTAPGKFMTTSGHNIKTGGGGGGGTPSSLSNGDGGNAATVVRSSPQVLILNSSMAGSLLGRSNMIDSSGASILSKQNFISSPMGLDMHNSSSLSKQNFISPILDHTGARKRVDFPSELSYESKRRKSEKGGKGLRHFSMKVCEKVRTKGITTYNEVADELVQEFALPNLGMTTIEQQFDQKNIRRRVYDALNVLMAMNIISKEKKEIKWLGLPTNSMQECTTLEKDRQKRIERLKAKTQQLHDLIIQQVAFKSLVERNKEREKAKGPPPPHGSIHLPFLIVNTERQTVIDCSISSDKMEYLFNFDGTFEIHDDIEVLKRMGFALGLDKNECSEEQIGQAKKLLPKALEMYIDQIGKGLENEWGDVEGYEESDDASFFAEDQEGDVEGDGEVEEDGDFIENFS